MSKKMEDCGTIVPNLLELSADMKLLFRDSIMTDFSICINGKNYISCHKDILKFRSKWFLIKVREAEANGATQISIIDNMQVLEAVLLYIYTGNLQLLESLDISLLDLYQAAKRYALCSLLGVLSPIVKEKQVKEIMQNINFMWTIKVDDYSSLTAECPGLNGFSVCGTDKWKMEIKPIPCSNDSEPRNGIYVTRMAKESRGTCHILKILFYVLDKTKMVRHVFSNQYPFLEDGEYLLSNFLTHSEMQKSAEDLMPDGVLSLSCQIIMWAKIGYAEKFQLEGQYRRCIPNELQKLSRNLREMQRSGDTRDINVKLPLSSVHIHSYIYFIRCRLPKEFMEPLGTLARLGPIGWSSFVQFMYTGQVRYLQDHARDIYYALSRTQFTEAKKKYSNYLAKNLMFDNAFDLLCDAMRYKDDYLLCAAANFLASRSKTITDSKSWFQIAREKIDTGSFP